MNYYYHRSKTKRIAETSSGMRPAHLADTNLSKVREGRKSERFEGAQMTWQNKTKLLFFWSLLCLFLVDSEELGRRVGWDPDGQNWGAMDGSFPLPGWRFWKSGAQGSLGLLAKPGWNSLRETKKEGRDENFFIGWLGTSWPGFNRWDAVAQGWNERSWVLSELGGLFHLYMRFYIL